MLGFEKSIATQKYISKQTQGHKLTEAMFAICKFHILSVFFFSFILGAFVPDWNLITMIQTNSTMHQDPKNIDAKRKGGINSRSGRHTIVIKHSVSFGVHLALLFQLTP